MNPGILKHRADILVAYSTTSDNGLNEDITEWQVQDNRAVAVYPISAMEALKAGQLEATGKYRIKMRYTTSVDASHRLRLFWGGRNLLLAVEDATPTSDRKELHLLAHEVKDDEA